MTTQTEATVIDTPAGIANWHFTSRMFQIALELNTGMKSMKMPILKAMVLEGFLEGNWRGTAANKRLVLQSMVDIKKGEQPDWEVPDSITRALNGG